MKELKVYEAEVKTTKTGKTLKKLVLQEEGKQYPYKNVTIWEDNPLYAQAVSGATLSCEILEKDSQNINPNTGKPYIERSVANPNFKSPAEVQTMRTDTNIMQAIDGLRYSIQRIEEHLGTLPKPTIGNTNVPYPESETSNGDGTLGEAEIKPEDIPF